jgi:hypothetical protein
MTDLLIRDIDPQLKGKLEQSAETHKQSLSDEANVPVKIWITDVRSADPRY